MVVRCNTWELLLIYAATLAFSSGAVIKHDFYSPKRDETTSGLSIAVLGDSYGSGVAYLDSNRYHGTNDDNCYRWNQAYAAQLETDSDNLGKVKMQFLACAGSVLEDMTKGNAQILKTNGDVDLIILTAGGNNAHFYEVASSCIYHDKQPFDYGGLYPDPMGECAKSIELARSYILSGSQTPGRSLTFDLRATYDDLLRSKAYKSQPYTYHTGYVLLFNTSTEDDWCEQSQESFGSIPIPLPGQPRPPLSNALRSDINQLVAEWNDAMKTVIAEFTDKKFSYVEVSDRFEGHRFCERGSNHFNQYYDPNIWLWNFSPPLPEFLQPPIDSTVSPSLPEQLKESHVRGFWNTTTGKGQDLSSQSTNTGAGWITRPLHPKKAGHTAIKDAILEKIKQDKIGGARQEHVDSSSVIVKLVFSLFGFFTRVYG